jgi:hypothetical protein
MLNPYINNFANVPEQDLAADLIEESIQFYGYDVQYIPRSNLNYDKVAGESTNASFDTAFPIEMYIKSIDGYGGEGQFLSTIGMEIRNQALFSVSIRRWKVVAAAADTEEDIDRPREGDIIYFGLDNKLMEIKKVNRYSMFYQLGTLYTYDITCESFEYSGEDFNTGIEYIDSIARNLSVDTDEHGSVDANGKPKFDDGFDFVNKFADNKETDTQGSSWIDFQEDNPFVRKF